MKHVVALLGAVVGANAVEYPARPGSLEASSGTYSLGGFLCGKQEPTCNIWYPSDLSKGPFPIATYGHGMGGQMIEDLIKDAVSLGFVVVAPATSGGRCDDNHYKDMLHALDGSKAKPSLHEALGHVDWTRTAIFGHSMGGFATLFAGAEAMKDPSRYNVKAVLASHGYLGDGNAAAAKITVPAMFTTGTEDHRSNVKAQFDACTAKSKVLAAVEGAEHMEPQDNGRLNPFDAHFLACHVMGTQTSCDKITGKGATDMCQANKMTTCTVVNGGPGPSPGPTPGPSPGPRPRPTPGPSPGPRPGPRPHPTPGPSPGPSPSPDVPEKCQECFEKACPGKQGNTPACHQCLGKNMQTCAGDCRPTPFKTVADWFCKSGGDLTVVV